MSKRKYLVKNYTVGIDNPYGLLGMGDVMFLNLVPSLGITMKPPRDMPPVKINAWHFKSRRKEYIHIRCEIINEETH